MIDENHRPRISNPVVIDNGDAIGFRVERADGKSLDLVCTIDDVTNMIGFIAQCAGYATSSRPAKIPESGGTLQIAQIPADGIGLAHCPDPNQTALLVRLGGFHLAFSVPSTHLSELARDLAPIAATLSVGRGKPS